MLEEVEELAPQNDTWITAYLEYPFGRGINFQITVKYIDRMYRRLTDKSYPIQLPLEKKSYRAGGIFITVRQFMIIDPDGYLLRLNSLANVDSGAAHE